MINWVFNIVRFELKHAWLVFAFFTLTKRGLYIILVCGPHKYSTVKPIVPLNKKHIIKVILMILTSVEIIFLSSL